jgi:hypothetical protein
MVSLLLKRLLGKPARQAPLAELNPDELRGFFLGYQAALKIEKPNAFEEYLANTLKSDQMRQIFAQARLNNAK